MKKSKSSEELSFEDEFEDEYGFLLIFRGRRHLGRKRRRRGTRTYYLKRRKNKAQKRKTRRVC